MEVRSNKLPEIIRDAPRKLTAALIKTAAFIQGEARRRAPVRTGNLRNSITIELQDAWHALIGPAAEYGIHVELGTYRMRAQPYLGPAVEAAVGPFEQAIAEAINSF